MFYVSIAVALIVAVIIHEFAHAYSMKKYGVDVEEFGVGLPFTPKLFGFTIPWGKSRMKVKVFPLLLGAYVKPKNEEDLESLPATKQTEIYANGIFWNLITACLAFAITVVGLGGITATTLAMVAAALLLSALFFFGARWISPFVPALGIAFVVASVMLVMAVMNAPGGEAISGRDAVVGPVGIVHIFGSMAMSFFEYLFWISLFLGLTNMIPISPLDGGRTLLVLLEKINVPKRVTRAITVVGTVFILTFAAFIFYNDFARLLA